MRFGRLVVGIFCLVTLVIAAEDNDTTAAAADTWPEYTFPDANTTHQCVFGKFPELCFRQCDAKGDGAEGVITYSGITPISSPWQNGQKLDYDLAKLEILYKMGRSFMYFCEKTPLFDLVKTVVSEEWFSEANAANRNNKILDLMQLELNWFLVIIFFLTVLVFLTIFVTFSILDGLFGWTDSTKRQKMEPSNGFWVNFYGFLIIMFTIFVLLGCLLCFVGNNLVSENRNQTNIQLNLDYDWAESYQSQGKKQLNEFINEFEVLLTEVKELYEAAVPAAVDVIWAKFQVEVTETFYNTAASLNENLNGINTIGDLANDVNITINIVNITNTTIYPCLETILVVAEAFCKDIGHDSMDDADCWTDKIAKNFDKVDITLINATLANITQMLEDKVVETMLSASVAIQTAINAKIFDDVQKGVNLFNGLKNLLKTRTADNRTAFEATLNQAKIMAYGQEDSFAAQMNLGFRDFTRAIQFPTYFFGTTSPLSALSDVRSYSFIAVNVISIATVFVGVFAWCVGCCNFRADQRPTSRAGKSHIPGQIIYYSSYVALFLSLFTITCGVLYFIPTSLFSFTCKTYEAGNTTLILADGRSEKEMATDQNFFMFWDDHLFVDHNVIGKQIHGDGTLGPTWHEFFQRCFRNYGLFPALELTWDLGEILDLNSTLDTNFFVEELKKASFADQYLMRDAAVTALQTLSKTLAELDLSVVTFEKGEKLFKPGGSYASIEEVSTWMKNLDAFYKVAKKKAKSVEDEVMDKFADECIDIAIDDKKLLDELLGKKSVDVDLDKVTDLTKRSISQSDLIEADVIKKRGKREFNWESVTPDDGSDDSSTSLLEEDYTEQGIGLLFTTFSTYIGKVTSSLETITTKTAAAKMYAEKLESLYNSIQPNYLVETGPTLYKNKLTQYGGFIFDEIDCFVIMGSAQITEEMGQCRTIFDVVDGTMKYFCNFLVGPMTVTWMAFFLIGIGLTLYIQAARSVAMYFLRMDETHPGDITDEEKVAAMRG